MAAPDLHGLNLLDPRKITAYGTAYHGLSRTHDGGDVFTVSGTVTEATTAFQIISYADYSLSDKGYDCQIFHISGDRVVMGAYGFRNASERALAINVDVQIGQTVSETFGVTVSAGGLPAFRAFTYPMIYDRGEVDVYRARFLRERFIEGTETADEKAEWDAGLRGAMSHEDWQRIYDAIQAYRLYNSDTGISGTDVSDYKNGAVDRTGYISTVSSPALDALKNICEAMVADGVNYTGALDFGDGKTLTYQQANNIERLLAVANTGADAWFELNGGVLTIRGAYSAGQTGDTVSLE